MQVTQTSSREILNRRAVKVFYSYSHNDETFRVELEKHLSLLRRHGEITGWHDRQISAGTNWKASIDEHLEGADIVLLLVSADFLASDYCEMEMKRAMELHEEGEVLVIPVILRECDWHSAPFADLQVLPTNAKAIKSWDDPDEAYDNVVTGIRQAIAGDPGVITGAVSRSNYIRNRRWLLLSAFGIVLMVALAITNFGKLKQIWTRRDENVTKIRGFVFDPQGKPIEGATVTIDAKPSTLSGMTSSSGFFIINAVPGKPDDWIVLHVTKEGYIDKTEPYILNNDPKEVQLTAK